MNRGEVRIINDFYSDALKCQKNLRVYLPPGYGENDQRYPVVYLHDGQWVFSEEGVRRWNVDLIADELICDGKISPVILVGVDCYEEERRREMTHITPPPFRRMGKRGYVSCFSFRGEGRGEQYEACLTYEVKPYIDSHYRTMPEKEHTLLAGSSMGGLVSLSMGMNRHDTYGMLGLLSPAIHWLPDSFYNKLEFYDQKIWLDCGMAESYYVDNVRELYKIFCGLGYSQKKGNIHFLVQPEAVHTEKYFGQRFKMMLQWMFGEPSELASVDIQGRNTASLGGHQTILNTVAVSQNGVMDSEMEADYQVDPEGIFDISPSGEIMAKKPGTATVTYNCNGVTASKDITVINSLSLYVILNIKVKIPEDTPENEPIVYHFFRDQYCVLERAEGRWYVGSIGVPRDWEFYGHFTRCIENRDKKRECTKDRGEVDRFVRASDHQSLCYEVEAWKE